MREPARSASSHRPAQPAPVLKLSGISKRYPGVMALQGVDFDLYPGELHVVVGENGAGKSTLIKAMAGATTPNEGEILFDGEVINNLSVSARKRLGLQVIYQELSLVSTLPVMQNIFLGAEFTHGPGLGKQFRVRDVGRMRRDCADLLARLGINVDPRAQVASLSVADKQLIEIAKALAFNARVIVMDEPTTSLGPNEKRRLFTLIGDLKAKGIAIIFVSHILEDCIELGDRITVLRDGRYIKTLKRGEANAGDLVQLITGRSFSERYLTIPSAQGRPILELRNLAKGKHFQDVSFTLHEGEILGFAGLVGAGRTDLMRAIAGLDPVDSGEVVIAGELVRNGNARSALKRGIAILTEDRKVQGLLPKLDIATNIAATAINLPSTKASRLLTVLGRVLRRSRMKAYANERIAALRIKAHSPRQLISHLSGGNQQKALLARALAADARILILDEPTKGIDAGAKGEIYDVLGEMVQQGLSVLVVSSETPEVLALCSRILVMNRGRIAAEMTRGEATLESIVAHATRTLPSDNTTGVSQ